MSAVRHNASLFYISHIQKQFMIVINQTKWQFVVVIHIRTIPYTYCIIKQGDSDCEVIICLVQRRSHKVIEWYSGLGFTLRHCHKLFVE